MIAVFKYIKKRGRARERRIPFSPHQWQLEQETMNFNRIREHKIRLEKPS